MSTQTMPRIAQANPEATIRATWLSLPQERAQELIAEAAVLVIEDGMRTILVGQERANVLNCVRVALSWAIRGGVEPNDFLVELHAVVAKRISAQ